MGSLSDRPIQNSQLGLGHASGAFAIHDLRQGLLISHALGPYLDSRSNCHLTIPFDEASRYDPTPLPELVEAQLRYDHCRLGIISHFHGICSSYTGMTDVLWPLVEASQTVAFENYYPDAEPTKDDCCPGCSIALEQIHGRYT
jgi:hypothetical protein